MAGQGWELFQHDADVGIRGYGPTPAAAFEQAALALTAAVCEPSQVAERETLHVACDASDREMLFVNWIDSLIYEMATRRMLFSRFHIVIRDLSLEATVAGEALDVTRHQPAVEVKGATLTELRVAEDRPGVWTAQCVIDV